MDWDWILNRHETDMVLITKQSATYNLMRQRRGWQLVDEDALSGLFVREGRPHGDSAAAHAGTAASGGWRRPLRPLTRDVRLCAVAAA